MDVKKEEGRSWALAFAGARWRQLRGRAWCASAAALLRGRRGSGRKVEVLFVYVLNTIKRERTKLTGRGPRGVYYIPMGTALS